MSAQRRPMTAALQTAELSEKEQAFVRGNGVKRAVKAIPDPIDEDLAEPVNETSTAAPARTRPKGTIRVIPSLVGLATRIPADLHERLMRASFERKLEHVEPSTHQDIVTEALSEWFKRRGY